MQITVRPKFLAAALCTAAVSDVRYYLVGVHVAQALDHTRYEATNGSALLVLRHPVTVPLLPCSAIIPADVAKLLTKSKAEEVDLTSDDGKEWTFTVAGVTTRFKPIEGVFPDVHRVIPDKVSGKAGNYDPELIALFGKAAKAIGSTSQKVHLHQNGPTSGAVVALAGLPEFCGVIMPLRAGPRDAPVPPLPTWARA